MHRQAASLAFHPWNKPLGRAGVYRVIHLASGQIYIGISQNVQARARQHAYPKGSSKLANAVRLHGPQAFLFEPLFYCTDKQGDNLFLAELEAELIAAHDSTVSGLNVTKGNGRVGPYGAEFSKTVAASHAKRTPEQRSSIVRKAKAAMSAELLSAIGKRNALSVGPEVLSARMKKWQSSRTPEERAKAAGVAGKASALARPEEEKRDRGRRLSAFRLATSTYEERLASFKLSALGNQSAEQLRENGRKGVAKANAQRTPEERRMLASQAAKASHDSRTPEERRAMAQKAGLAARQVMALKSKEELSAASAKAWETRVRLGKTNTPTKGSRWINNGSERRRLPDGSELPPGWFFGWPLNRN